METKCGGGAPVNKKKEGADGFKGFGRQWQFLGG